MSANNFTEVKNKRVPKYVPMAENVVEDVDEIKPTDRAPTMVEKFGRITVVAASTNLLFTFLGRQLHFLSTRNEEEFGKIVQWASATLNTVTDAKDQIKRILSDITFESPGSKAARVFGCERKVSESSETYSFSHWLTSKNSVPQEIAEQNTLTLADARSNHLLDQICFRLTRVIRQLERDGTCSFDYAVLGDFQDLFTTFNTLRTEANQQLDELVEYKKSHRPARTNTGNDQRRTNSSQNRAQNAPKKTEEVKKPEEPVRTATPIAKKANALPASAFKTVSQILSYADMANGSKPLPSVPAVEKSPATVSKPLPSIPVVEKVQATEEVLEQPVSTSNPVTATKKKAAKRAAQKTRKALAEKDAKSTDATEMVQVQRVVVVDGKPTMTTMVMSKADLSKLETVTLPQ